MAFLLHLPPELLQLIFSFLPRQSLAHLTLTCRTAYDVCLPSLYAQVRLGLRTHVRQLEEGLLQRPKLKETMKECTQRLTLTNQQKCNMWVTRDFAWLFSAVTHVRRLTLVHFDGLSVEYLSRLAQQLPGVEHLDIEYSHLRPRQDNPNSSDYSYNYYHQQEHQQQQHSPSLPSSTFTPHPAYRGAVFSKATHLRLCWTDFSEAAIADLFRLLPNIEQVDLGANRNKNQGANTTAVRAIAEHCSLVKNLTISLQQVSEPVLCNTIAYYGSQLHSLSIRCDGRDTLRCVARHATQVKDLTIRAGLIPPPSSPPPTAQQLQQQQQTTADVVLTLGNNRSRQDTHPQMENAVEAMTESRGQGGEGGGADTAGDNEPEHGSIVGILQRCPLLVRLEMVSWLVDDVPREVWRGVEAVASRRKAVPLLPQRDLPQESKTLALGVEELQEIRKQFMTVALPLRTLQKHPLASLSTPPSPFITSR